MGFRVRRTIQGVSLQPLEVVGQYKTRDRITELCVAEELPCDLNEFAFTGAGVFFKGFRRNSLRDAAGLPTGQFYLNYPPAAPQDSCDTCYVFVDTSSMAGFRTQYAVTSIDTLRITDGDFTESPVDPGEMVDLLPATEPASNLERVAVVPNPYRHSAEWNPPGGGHAVHFIHLPPDATVRIFTTSLELMRTLKHDVNSSPGGQTGELAWDLRNEEGRTIVSGIYVYQVETPDGRTKRGHFVIIK